MGMTIQLPCALTPVPGRAQMLQAKGCETLQGFLFSKPLEANEVLPFLQQWRGHAAVYGEAPSHEARPAPAALAS